MFFTFNRCFFCSAILICCLLQVQTMRADIFLSDVGVAVIENFDDFRGNGFAPAAELLSGKLDSNTYRAVGFSNNQNGAFEGTFESGAFARGVAAGAVVDGGTYAFEITPSNFALGVQPTDSDFNPGALTIRVTNDTGQAISGFQLGGDGYFYNDTDHSTPWTFAVSLDDNVYSLPLQTLNSPETADTNGWAAVPVGGFIPFFSPLADGDRFYLRITAEMGGSGARDQFALDNLSLTAVPEPSSIAILVLMMFPLLRHRSRRPA